MAQSAAQHAAAGIMKFELDPSSDSLLVRSYERDHLIVGDRRIASPVVITGSRLVDDLLPPRMRELAVSHLLALAELGADIVILGTGARQVFLSADFIQLLSSRGVGLETMDTAAACRCYNILRAESRAVVLAAFMLNDDSTRDA